jgi:ABC-type Fe3+/spermidine/putrescine transport system ATPase subunit
VALARAIVIRPALLLLDEPLSALDRKLRVQMQVELRQLQRQTGLTTLYVTHDQEEALALSDRIVVLNGGRLQQCGSPREVYERPANAFVVDFIGVANLFEADLVADGSAGPRARVGRGLVALAPTDPPPASGRVRLALRPEQVRLSGEAGPGALPARVATTVYLGTTTHVHLDLADGPRLVAFVQNTSSGADPFVAGASVWVSWEPASLRIVRG